VDLEIRHAEFARLQVAEEECFDRLPALLACEDERLVLPALLLAFCLREAAEPLLPTLLRVAKSGPPALREYAAHVAKVCGRARGEPDSPYSRAKREDRVSLAAALLRFYDSNGRLPGDDDSLQEFEARLVMRTLEGLLRDEIERIEVYRKDHRRVPSDLGELGGDLAGDSVKIDLGYDPLYGNRWPSLVYWPSADGKSYIFGVRMSCGAWFGLAPNMWLLDFLTSPEEKLEVHPEDFDKKYYTEGRWAVWYSG
jgi:hypothetical protein